MILPYIMILALVVTILLEVLFTLIIKIRDKKDIINIILVNVLTNPLLVSITYVIFLKYGEGIQKIVEIVMEIIIIVVEGILYKKYLKFKKINPFLISFILNLSSYTIGSLLIDKLQHIIIFNQI